MRAPWSLIPAVPAALGLACGILLAGAPLWATVAGAVAAVACVALCAWRGYKFIAAAPVALLAGLVLALTVPDPQPYKAPAAGGIVSTVYASPLSGEAAAFVTTTMVADGAMLPHALRDDFRASGLAHILALSGFHVGIVAMLVMMLTRPMLLNRRLRHVRGALVLAAVWSFALLGGLSPSLVRAAVMCSLLIIAGLSGRYTSAWNSLAVAAIVILAWRPAAIYDVGFQLSFAAVAGILTFSDVLNPFDRDNNPRLHALAAAVAVPIGATLATAPIVGVVFGKLPLLFLPANIIAGILFTPFYILALALVALSSLGLPCGWIAAAVDGIYALMARTASAFALQTDVAVTPAAFTTAIATIILLRIYLGYKKSSAGAQAQADG
ncbi:MAG: ComEC/Rec2 family competence protein [Muribaculaceae bacterium]|nr:ComEC/Rec2 family competence protein [Muribaculaceae bacterium]